MGNDTHSLPQAAIDAISARLAALPDLRLPAQLQSGASEQRKKEYLQALLLHDPGEWCWFERPRRRFLGAELHGVEDGRSNVVAKLSLPVPAAFLLQESSSSGTAAA